MMQSFIEEVKIDGVVAAIIVRSGFHPDGIQFVTPDDYSQQLGYMRRPAGYVIQPHVHLHVDRKASFTRWTFIVKMSRTLILVRFSLVTSFCCQRGAMALK